MKKHLRALCLTVSLTLIACGGAKPSADAPEPNEALGKDGVQRYCDLGRALSLGGAEAAVFTRVNLREDGRADLERVLTAGGGASRAYRGEFAPHVLTAAWRGAGGSRLTVERVNPRLALSDRGLYAGPPPAWMRRSLNPPPKILSPRRAVRIRPWPAGAARPGAARTLVPCVALAEELTEDLPVAPGWLLEVALGAAELRDRRAYAPGAARDLAPVGVPRPRDLTEADRARRWCAHGFEFVSFRPRGPRELAFRGGRAVSGHRPVAVTAVEDQEGTRFLIDRARAGEPEAWFRDCP